MPARRGERFVAGNRSEKLKALLQSKDATPTTRANAIVLLKN
jgi:hypothetical protein